MSAPPAVRQWIENEIAAARRALTGVHLEPPVDLAKPAAWTPKETLQVLVFIQDNFATTLDEMIGWWHQQRIRERAYEVWERAGRPEGKAVEHWLQAEAEMRHADRGESPKRLALVSVQASRPAAMGSAHREAIRRLRTS